MSEEDLFEEDIDDPGVPLSPVEFSGVSEISSTSPKSLPSSQLNRSTSFSPAAVTRSASRIPASVNAADPANQSPTTSSSSKQEFICPRCAKILKTKRGFTGHIARHEVKDGPSGAEAASTVHGDPPQAKKGHFCFLCKREFATDSGFRKHQASHRLKDANERKPDEEEFENILLDVWSKVTDDMLAEYNYGQTSEAKFEFLKEFKAKTGSDEWLAFVNLLSSKISSIVCEKKTKVLPLNQYEESQQLLNSYLCDKSFSELLTKSLCAVREDPVLDSVLARRLVFRFAFKVFEQFQIWVCKSMRAYEIPRPNSTVREMSELEETSFKATLGDLLRKLVRKGLKSSEGETKSACIKNSFVDGQQPISMSQFLNKDNWYSGEEDSIVISDHAFNFFKIIESTVCSLGRTSYQTVIEAVLQNQDALNFWFFLTNNYFPEETSLLFMRNITTAFVKESFALEEKRANREEIASIRASETALRTHLKKNIVEKEVEEALNA